MPRKLAEKIWQWEYAEMAELLPGQWSMAAWSAMQTSRQYRYMVAMPHVVHECDVKKDPGGRSGTFERYERGPQGLLRCSIFPYASSRSNVTQFFTRQNIDAEWYYATVKFTCAGFIEVSGVFVCVHACVLLKSDRSRQIGILISTLRWVCVLWFCCLRTLDCARFEKKGMCIWYCMHLKHISLHTGYF